MQVGRIIQLTDSDEWGRGGRTRVEVVRDADVVIGPTGRIIKHRDGTVGADAAPELLDRAIPYPEAQDEVADVMQILNNLRDRGASLPHIQGALDRYVAERYGAMNGLKLLAAERTRQINVKGHDEEHDDGHTASTLAYEAMTRIGIVLDTLGVPGGPSTTGNYPLWAYDTVVEERAYLAKVKDDPIRELVKAGALICAEIDRLLRASDSADGA